MLHAGGIPMVYGTSKCVEARKVSSQARQEKGSSASAVLDKHLSDVEKARQAEEQMKEQIKALDDTRVSRPSVTTPRSPNAMKRLTPIKTGSPRKAPPTSTPSNVSTTPTGSGAVKFGPGTKMHDGSTFSRHGSGGKGHKLLHKSASDPSKLFTMGSQVQIPVTILGLDIDDNLQEVKVKRILHGPTGQPMPVRKGHIRHSSDPNAAPPSPDLGDEFCLKGRCASKASILSVAEESEDMMPPAGSPPRLTPLASRIPSAKQRSMIREYAGSKKPYILDLDHMHLSQHSSPVMDGALHTHPTAQRFLPATPTFITEAPEAMREDMRNKEVTRGDMRVTDCSMEFSPLPESERCSPQSMDEDDDLPLEDMPALTTSKSVLKEGSFKIEDTRIVRTSDDSGCPEDKGSSSKSSSTNSSVSNLSAGSPGPSDSQVVGANDRLTSGTVSPKILNSKSSNGGCSKTLLESQRSDKRLSNSGNTGMSKSEDKKSLISSAKLRSVAQDNAIHRGSKEASVCVSSGGDSEDKTSLNTQSVPSTTNASTDNAAKTADSALKSVGDTPLRRTQSIRTEKSHIAPRPRSRSVPRPKESPPAPPPQKDTSVKVSKTNNNHPSSSKLSNKNLQRMKSMSKESLNSNPQRKGNVVLSGNAKGGTGGISKPTPSTQTPKVRPTISAPFSCVTTANIASKPTTTLVRMSAPGPVLSQDTTQTSLSSADKTNRSSLSKSQQLSPRTISLGNTPSSDANSSSQGANSTPKGVSTTPRGASTTPQGACTTSQGASSTLQGASTTPQGASTTSQGAKTTVNSNFKRGPSIKVQSIQRPAQPPPRPHQPCPASQADVSQASLIPVQKDNPTPKPASSSKPDVPSKPSPPPRPPPPSSLSIPMSLKSTTESSLKVKSKNPLNKSLSEDNCGQKCNGDNNTLENGKNQQTASTSKIMTLLKVAQQNNSESTQSRPASEHTGPVIQDPFESLHKEREQVPSKEAKPRSAVTKKPLTTKKMPSKETRQVSAGKKKGKLRNNSSNLQEPPDAKVTLRPRSSKKGKGKKKGKDGKDSMELSDKSGADDKTFISGIGWHIMTDCADRSDVHAVVINNDSDDTDDDSPRVQPNYLDGDGDLRASLRASSDKIRRSIELAKCAMPGQVIEAGDELTSSDEDEEGIEEAEAVVEQVVFEEPTAEDPTPRIVGEKYGRSEKILEKLIQTAEQNSRGAGYELLPQTAKAINDFSKSVSNRDLMEMLGSDTPRTASDGSDKSKDSNSAGGQSGKTILVSEALPGSYVSMNIAPSQNSSSTAVKTDSVVNTSRVQNNSKSTGPGYLLSKPVPSKTQTATVNAGAGRDKTAGNNANHRATSRQVTSPKPVHHSSISSTPHSSNKQPSPATSAGKSVPPSKPTVSPKPKPPVKKSNSLPTPDREESEINDMIDEILKSTPDPSLSLSYRNSKRERGEKTMTKDEFAAELRRSQERAFQQVPNRVQPLKTTNEEDQSVVKDGSFPSSEEEYETLERLANAVKNLPLQISVSEKECSGVKGKPPVAPKSTAAPANIAPALERENTEAKSPRFIRKHDSYKAAQHAEVHRDKSHDSHMTDMSGISLPPMADDSFVPSNRAEVVTSRLGRSGHVSRAGSSMTNDSHTNDDLETIQWKRGNMLGKGAYGTVWCGLTNSGGLIAVKQIELNVDNMDKAEVEYEKIQEEVELLKNLNHKNIVGYLGTSLEESTVSIFMQFVPGGSIANILARFGALEEEVFCHYTRQILEGVEYLHANNVIHRDIKGGNIMLMPNGDIKLIDFGCAKRLCINMSSVSGQKMNSSYSRLLKSMRGTPYWMAPEVVKEEGHGTKSDIWSVGCTVFEMATRKPPWADMPPMTAIFSIGSNKKSVPQLPDKFSSDAKDFTNACLTRDQNKRPSSTQLLNHVFIQNHRRSKTGSFS